jgi:hypothetical protein
MMKDQFSVAVCEQAQTAAVLVALLSQPPVAEIVGLLLASSDAGNTDVDACAIEAAVLRDVIPGMAQRLSWSQRWYDLLQAELVCAAKIHREEAQSFLGIRCCLVEAMEAASRSWVSAEFEEFSHFATVNEPVWRTAAFEAGRARQEAEQARREQAALQQALDHWRNTMRDQRAALLESCTRQKQEWFQQSEDWFVCVGIDAKDQMLAAMRKEQQRKSEEWIRGYHNPPTLPSGQQPARPASAASGYYQPASSAYGQPQSGAYQPPPSGYYQPRPQTAGTVPAYAAASTSGANFGIAQTAAQPAAIPGAKVGFQATPTGKHAAPPGLFGSLFRR